MKKMLILLVGVLMSTVPTFAQFSNVGGSSQGSSGSLVKDCNSYDRIGIEYLNRSISYDGSSSDDDMSTNGVGIYYLHGISLSKDIPLFLEIGGKLDAGFWSDSVEEYYYDTDQNLTTLSLSVPVNLSYKFSFGNGDFSIQPYLGLVFRGNLLAKLKYSYDDGDEDKYDLFDKKDYSNPWKRFQLGWHIGAGFNYKQFYMGLSYGTDFIKIAKKTNTGTFAVGIGVNI